MQIITKKYQHYLSNHIDISMNLDEPDIPYNIYVVYFINCLVNENYFEWLNEQIRIVYDYGTKIYIIATLDPSFEEEFREKVHGLYPNVLIECVYENEYEYPGIKKVWDLGQLHSSSNDIILYFHSKGVSRHRTYESNRNDKYNIILKDIDKIKEIYTLFPSIDKIGYCCSNVGWMWYNFWFSRGSYISLMKEPVKITRRHYYESWLGAQTIIKTNRLLSCYSFYTDYEKHGNIGSYYNPRDGKYYIIE